MQIAGQAQAFLVSGTQSFLNVENTELLAHAVYVGRERPQLIAILDAEVPAEIALCDALDAGADCAKWAEDREGDHESKNEREEKTCPRKRDYDDLRSGVCVPSIRNTLDDLCVGAVDELVGEQSQPIAEWCYLHRLRRFGLSDPACGHEVERSCRRGRKGSLDAANSSDRISLFGVDVSKPIEAVARRSYLPERRIDTDRFMQSDRPGKRVQLGRSRQA